MTSKEAARILKINSLDMEQPMGTGLLRTPTFLDRDSTGMTFKWQPNSNSKNTEILIRPSLAILFAGLKDVADTEIIRVAQRWGALGIADDGWPPEVLHGWAGDPWRETFSAWRLFAGRLQDLITLAAEFNRLKAGPKKDYISRGISQLMNLMAQRFKLAPRFRWDENHAQWEIAFDGFAISNLPALLIVQMMLIVGDKNGFAFCSNCKVAYPVTRKPAFTRRSFCPKAACRRAELRDYQRAARKNRREAKRLREQGLSVGEIATQMAAKPSTVKRWIKE